MNANFPEGTTVTKNADRTLVTLSNDDTIEVQELGWGYFKISHHGQNIHCRNIHKAVGVMDDIIRRSLALSNPVG